MPINPKARNAKARTAKTRTANARIPERPQKIITLQPY